MTQECRVEESDGPRVPHPWSHPQSSYTLLPKLGQSCRWKRLLVITPGHGASAGLPGRARPCGASAPWFYAFGLGNLCEAPHLPPRLENG